MQTLANKNEVPPGGFRYFQQETQKWITAPSWGELLIAVKKHRRANELPIGLMFDQEVESQLCSTLPPGSCNFTNAEEQQRAALIARPTWQKFLDGTRTLIEMKRAGNKLATREEAEKNAATCAKCMFNQKPEGCSTCNLSGLVDLLAGLGGLQTSQDGRLEGCLLCGCSLKAKVHFPAEVLAKVAGQTLEAYPEWCWMKGIQAPV